MEFEWDESKRLTNIDKHGFDFVAVRQLFEHEHVKGMARSGKDGEQRFTATGFVYGVYATAIYTIRGDATRIISLRRARVNERREHQALHGG